MAHVHQHAHALAHHHRRQSQRMLARDDTSATIQMDQTRALLPRSTCTNDSDPGCHKPTEVPTLPVVLAVVIPVVLAAVVLLILHRRHIRKLKEEDRNDPHKSLDFGMEVANAGKKGKKRPEMALIDTEKASRRDRQMSLDMDMPSPYIMPAALHGSTESLQSMSRSMHDPHDPYGPVTFGKDNGSIRSGNRNRYGPDNMSTYTGSSGGTDRKGLHDGLLRNAQRMSHSHPPRGESMSPEGDRAPEIRFPEPAATTHKPSPLNPGTERSYPSPPPPAPLQPAGGYAAFKPADAPAAPRQAMTSPEPIEPNVQETQSPSQTSPKPTAPRPRIQSQEAVVLSNHNTASFISTSSYGDGFKVTPPSPPREPGSRARESGPLSPEPLRPNHDESNGLGVEGPDPDQRRLSMSLRPLPPDDPNDNPEQRANRIRSFYKEYFDDSKPEPAGGHVYNDYVEDYGSEYLDGTVFDPETGAFVVAQPQAPFAQPVTRRAMTPPPRAPPRFRSNTGPRSTHMSGGSAASSGRFIPPRGMSSMSGRMAAPSPRRPMPPPAPLASLPTPAQLREDTAIFNATDFAPPVSFRDRQNGMRPDSPLGAPRPFSPSVRPHTPLASSYDDLAVMPSPHMLRKSGTFTALDFAPPPRFRDPGSNASDAGSIRSNRSGMSAAGRMAVRNGAYRVSRIPKDVVSTRDDMFNSLRPKMNMVESA